MSIIGRCLSAVITCTLNYMSGWNMEMKEVLTKISYRHEGYPVVCCENPVDLW